VAKLAVLAMGLYRQSGMGYATLEGPISWATDVPDVVHLAGQLVLEDRCRDLVISVVPKTTRSGYRPWIVSLMASLIRAFGGRRVGAVTRAF
jgi:hypothetical protein